MSKIPLPEVKWKVLGRDTAAGLRPSSAPFHSPPNDLPQDQPLEHQSDPTPAPNTGSGPVANRHKALLAAGVPATKWEVFKQWGDA